MKNTLNQLKTFIVLGIVGTIDHQVHYYIESLLAKDKNRYPKAFGLQQGGNAANPQKHR